MCTMVSQNYCLQAVFIVGRHTGDEWIYKSIHPGDAHNHTHTCCEGKVGQGNWSQRPKDPLTN